MSLINDNKVHARTVVKIEQKAKLILSEQVIKKIDYLHQQVKRNTEWSGVLIYSTKEGSIADPSNWVLEASDIIPMDVGTGTYTEYEFSGDDDYAFDIYTEALMNDEKLGHIHTHHSMATFFSGTDMSELHENAPNHAYYLSFIVNYKESKDWVAKVAFVGEEVTQGAVTKTRKSLFNLVGFGQATQEQVDIVTPLLYTIDCELIVPETDDTTKAFHERVTEISKPKVTHFPGVRHHQSMWPSQAHNSAKNTKGRGLHTFGDLFDEELPAWKGKQASTPVKDKVVQTRAAELYNAEAIRMFTVKLLAMDLNTTEQSLTTTVKTLTSATDIEVEFHIDVVEEEFEDYIEKYFKLSTVTELDTYCVGIMIMEALKEFDETYLVQCLHNMLDVYISISRDTAFDKKATALTGITNLKDLEEWTL
mgnify:FL=1